MRFILMLGAATLVAPALVAAQAPVIPDWPIAAGSRVRILSPILGRTVQTGSIVSATSDTLVFRRGTQSTSTPIAAPSIVSIDVAQGTHTRKLAGGLLGLALGAGVEAIIGDVTYKPYELLRHLRAQWERGGRQHPRRFGRNAHRGHCRQSSVNGCR
jgi:hypothetical protein